jgi:hypothetical protein
VSSFPDEAICGPCVHALGGQSARAFAHPQEGRRYDDKGQAEGLRTSAAQVTSSAVSRRAMTETPGRICAERANPMSSITLAVSDSGHPVPGFAVERVADLFCTHDPAVRAWIAEQREAAGDDGCVLVADPDWVNPGDGTQSLSFPVGEQDAEVVDAIRAHLKTMPVLNEDPDDT